MVFTAHLSLETDPYLVDHNFQGSYLFPTVFGLEAMAQAGGVLAFESRPAEDRGATSPPAVRTAPAERSREVRRTASATWASVSP